MLSEVVTHMKLPVCGYVFTYRTPNPTHITTMDHGAPEQPAHIVVPRHQKLPGQFWQSSLHWNPKSDILTYLPVNQLVRVTKKYMFC